MNENVKRELRRIASLSPDRVGDKEENVKLKIIVPILECLGHSRHDLEFEYGRGKEIDIFIKGLPRDSTVIIETKRYDADLNPYLNQLENYAREVNAVLAVIANGEEIRFYSPYMRGYKFEESLIYSIKRRELKNPSKMKILENLLSRKNLRTGKAARFIDKRELEIKKKHREIQKLKRTYEKKLKKLMKNKKRLEQKISTIERMIERLEKKKEKEIQKIINSLGLPPLKISVSKPQIPKRPLEINIEDYLKDKNDVSKQLFYLLREKILSLGKVKEFVKDKRIYYRRIGDKERTFVGLTLFKRKEKLHILLGRSDIEDPRNIITKKWGKSPHFYVNSKDEIDYAFRLISQVYNK